MIGICHCVNVFFRKMNLIYLMSCTNKSKREGRPFTAIIDGANVAYYMQNFAGGSFNFHQIQFMVEALEKMNEMGYNALILCCKDATSFLLVNNCKTLRFPKETQIWCGYS